MNKLSLNIDDLQVASFETEREDEGAAAAITGPPCYTRPTAYETCCTN